MNDEVRDALKRAITECLPEMQQLSVQHREPHLTWTRNGLNSWKGAWLEKPDVTAAFIKGNATIDRASADFDDRFRKHHADHTGMVGVGNYGFLNFGHDLKHIVRRALGELWMRHGTFECDNSQIDSLVAEFGEFVDQPTVPVLFSAQLINFTSDSDEKIDLPNGIKIRKLTDEEVSDIYGGTAWGFVMQPRASSIHSFVLEGQCDGRKYLSTEQSEDASSNHVRELLDRAVLALRTFREGAVGYEHVRYKPMRFCPTIFGSNAFLDLHIPSGTYSLPVSDVKPFLEHAEKIMMGDIDPSMEMACSRLADSQTRFRPADRLVDAVIGLESLLLAAVDGEDRRGELSYRFSLHYSALFEDPKDRYAAYKVAKHLYGLRSKIAHGNPAKTDKYDVGDQKLSLQEAAIKATEVLRKVVQHFLGTGGFQYKNMSYWEKALFGIRDTSA